MLYSVFGSPVSGIAFPAQTVFHPRPHRNALRPADVAGLVFAVGRSVEPVVFAAG